MMEAKDFIYGLRRMCKYYSDNCKYVTTSEIESCPMRDYNCKDVDKLPDNAFDIVEKWVKLHPIKTRQDEFLKQFTKANVDENGVIRICPNYIDSTVKCYAEVDCEDCRKKYWNEVVE